MNEENRLILENQWAIMKALFNQDEESDGELIKQLDKTNELINPKINPTLKERTHNDLKEEDKGCSCGFQVDKESKGCGKVIEEWTKEDDEGDIIDNGWYHCGENGMLCDECKNQECVKSEKGDQDE